MDTKNKNYNYFVWNDNSVSRIGDLRKHELSKALNLHKKRLKSGYIVLRKLHEQRTKITPDSTTINTEKVMLRTMKMRTRRPITTSNREVRLDAIIQTAMFLLDSEADFEAVKNCLKQAGVKND
tara:strand:- start:42 stop:413 length:372 start_codon:yes stop_codon:yes gene_type:complete